MPRQCGILYIYSEYPTRINELLGDLVKPGVIFVEVTILVVNMALGVIYKSPLMACSALVAIEENLVSITSK